MNTDQYASGYMYLRHPPLILSKAGGLCPTVSLPLCPSLPINHRHGSAVRFPSAEEAVAAYALALAVARVLISQEALQSHSA